MNFAKNFKWQLVAVALGASLLMTGKVYSQEIENTNFAAPATSMGGNFNTNAPGAVNTASANPQAVYTPATGAAIRATNEMGELGASSFSLTAGPLLAIAILGAAYLVIRKASPNKRNAWKSPWNEHSARNQKPQVLQS